MRWQYCFMGHLNANYAVETHGSGSSGQGAKRIPAKQAMRSQPRTRSASQAQLSRLPSKHPNAGAGYMHELVHPSHFSVISF